MAHSQPQQREAAYTPDEKDPYCPASETGRAEECDRKSVESDTTVRETLHAAQDMYAQRQAQLAALTEVVAAETNLVKKSAMILVVGGVAAFTFGCFIWLIINVLLGAFFADLGIHYALNAFLLLCLNGGLAAFAAYAVKGAVKHLTLMPIINALKGDAGKE